MTLSNYNFYGFPVHHRTEMRNGCNETLILSLWNEDFFPSGASALLLESSPMRLSKLEREWQQQASPSGSRKKEANGTAANSEIASGVMEVAVRKFLAESLDHVSPYIAVPSLSSEENALQKARCDKARQTRNTLLGLGRGLTLSAVIAAFWDRLLDGAHRKNETVMEDRRVLQLLLKTCGSLPWQDAVPINCAPSFLGLSLSRKKSCVRLMRKLYDLLFEEGITASSIWDDYHLPEARTAQSYPTLVANNIESVMLTDGQMRTLLGQCFSSSVHWDIGFACFLIATQELSVEEVCGLNAGDLTYLPDFPQRLVVHIKRIFQPKDGNKNCSLIEVTDKYQRRVLPLPKAAVRTYETHIRTLDPNAPLLCNRARRMQPAVLKEQLNTLVRPLLRNPYTDVKKRNPSVIEVLRHTAQEELRNSGYEEEDLRYQKGLAPILTSAKSYCDFSNAVQLNTLGSMQDAWLSRLLSQKSTAATTVGTSVLPHCGQDLFWCTEQAGFRTQVTLTIDLHSVSSAASEDGIILEFTSDHALSGKAQYIGG